MVPHWATRRYLPLYTCITPPPLAAWVYVWLSLSMCTFLSPPSSSYFNLITEIKNLQATCWFEFSIWKWKSIGECIASGIFRSSYEWRILGSVWNKTILTISGFKRAANIPSPISTLVAQRRWEKKIKSILQTQKVERTHVNHCL